MNSVTNAMAASEMSHEDIAQEQQPFAPLNILEDYFSPGGVASASAASLADRFIHKYSTSEETVNLNPLEFIQNLCSFLDMSYEAQPAAFAVDQTRFPEILQPISGISGLPMFEQAIDRWDQRLVVTPAEPIPPRAPVARRLEKIPPAIPTGPRKIAPQPTEVVLIAGPGGTAFGKHTIHDLSTALTVAGETVHSSIVGTGETDISLEQVLMAIQKAKETDRPITLFIQTHGAPIEEQKGEHQILFGELWIPSRELFRQIKALLGEEYPLSIFMTSCHGGLAIKAAMEELPRGAVVVVLSNGDEPTTGTQVNALVNNLELDVTPENSPWDNAMHLVYRYLTKALKVRTSPQIAFVGGYEYRLDELFRMLPRLNEEQKANAHETLDYLMGREMVDMFIAKIESGENIRAEDYGPSLAVLFAAIPKVTNLGKKSASVSHST